MKKLYSEHHTTPESRGRYHKRLFLPKKFHTHWHGIFENLYGEEIVIFIEKINELFETEHLIDGDDLHKLREEIKSYGIHDLRRGS